MTHEAFDYVIVGAGSAGCTLAGRLTEDASVRVLLLEAGGWDNDPWIKIPLGFGQIRKKRLHDWGYFSEPQESVGGRRIECRRGKVIGGSSSINAMGWVRGHPSDFDRWASQGLPGWSYKEVLPYFKKQESWEHGESEYRGGHGPLTIRKSRYPDPLLDAVMQAGVQAGHPTTPDYNGAEQHGMSVVQSNIRNGRRCSAADAYLRPALARKNLTVRTHAIAHRIVIENGRAVGLVYAHKGEIREVRATREVLLSGGVINSPQLLMLSGVGDPVELSAHGIELKSPVPGVGKNFQDHVTAPLTFRRKSPGPLHKRMRVDRIVWDLVRGYFAGKGIATDLPGPLAAFLKTSSDLAVPDIQVLNHSAPLIAGPYLWPFKKPYVDGFSLLVVLLRPIARGRVELASTDPNEPVRIHQNFLGTEEDWSALARGVKLIRDISRQKALEPFVGEELLPGKERESAADIRAHIAATAATVHHPLGTCKMGPGSDPMAVVDGDLRVRGIDGLRVVDASVMPDLVGGNINSAIIMIAEKAADMIRESRQSGQSGH